MLFLPGEQNWRDSEFMYGAGVSALQTEKSPVTNMHHWTNAKYPAGHPLYYGNGVEFEQRYPEDLVLARSLGMNSFRFSLFSNRLLDKTGHFVQEGIDHYHRLIDKALELNLTLILTLQHFDPYGYYWHEPDSVNRYLEYATKMVDLYADKVRYFTPMNEPEVSVTLPYMDGRLELGSSLYQKAVAGNNMLVGINNQAIAHKLLYQYAQSYQQSDNPIYILTSKNIAYYEGYNNSWWRTMIADMADYFDTHYFLDQVAGYTDIIGVNYYWHRKFKVVGKPIADEKVTDTGARMSPEHLFDVLVKLAKFRKPILITEVGIADREDKYREWYFSEVIKAIARARDLGIDVKGMIAWALLSNFEMPPEGYDADFGLIAVNRDTQQRIIRPSAYQIPEMLREQGLLEEA